MHFGIQLAGSLSISDALTHPTLVPLHCTKPAIAQCSGFHVANAYYSVHFSMAIGDAFSLGMPIHKSSPK